METSFKKYVMKYLIEIVKKYWSGVLVIIILTVISSVSFGFLFNKTSVSDTIFINIGASGNKDISPFETVQAADHMSESIMGWLKNPSFLDKISEQSGYEPGLNVRRQEKQNIVVTFKTPDAVSAKKTASAIESVLRTQISKYNMETASSYKMIAFDHSYKENPVPLIYFAFFGIIAGAIIGYAFLSFWNIFMKEWHEYHR
jgi:hypothetical protein